MEVKLSLLNFKFMFLILVGCTSLPVVDCHYYDKCILMKLRLCFRFNQSSGPDVL